MSNSTLLRRPAGLEEADDCVMSNFDRKVDERIAAQVREGKHFAQYSAWDFCGYVWWTGTAFACEVWVYGSHTDTIVRDTLEEIMDAASDRYGSR